MENFIVSARKYRPSTFETVVGQSHITSTLKNAIARGQLAHAYLFCGPRGVGKTTCARIFAKTINCQNLTPSGDACGECESCRSFDEGRSFSIHELDAASNNSVEDIRNLIDQVRVPPQIGRYSVYIIDEVHMLSQQAFNAFLKTLEEPPQHAIFILATTEKHKIIPTILSRCQIYDFNRIRVEDAVGYLKLIAEREGVTYDDESLHLIARKADGGMRDALSMFDKAISFCGQSLTFRDVAATLNVLDYDTYFGITRTILDGDYKTALVIFDDVLKKGFSGQTFMSGLASHFRDLLMCKAPLTLSLLETTGSVLERYKAQSLEADASFLFDAISLLGEYDAGFRSATNQRLHVELGLMKLCGLGAQKKNPDLTDPSLPPLSRDNTQKASPTEPQAAPTPAPEPKPVTQSAPTPPSVAPTSEPAATTPEPATPSPTPQVAAAPAAESSVAAPKKAAAPKPEPKSDISADVPHKPIFGNSVSEILKGYTAEPESEEGEAEEEVFDPKTEEKIERSRTKFFAELQKERPRIAPALSDMVVNGHTISTTVFTEMVREEILRNLHEITAILQRTCGINGAVELDITVSHEKQASRPIKVEDKLKYLADKNPEVINLIKALDLQVD